MIIKTFTLQLTYRDRIYARPLLLLSGIDAG